MMKYYQEDDERAFFDKEINQSVQNLYSEFSGNKGVSVLWKNLYVTALIKEQHVFKSTKYKHKEIIHNMNGCVKPNSLVAIMGASGSGKSTLMSVLAHRYPAELSIDGDIRINGKKIQMKNMRRISGFVYQDDLFIPCLTVLEHMHFAGKLKLDRRISNEQLSQIISELLTDVGLLKCANSFIGSTNFGRGKINLSGGEQKRLSVATELLTNPSLLFCDEPTTGLDSFSALKLITIMKDLSEQKNKTIVCSVHQPSEQLFNLFHQVILLYNGQIAFSGTPNDGLEFFKSLGYMRNKHQNLADFLVKSLAIVPGNETKTAEQASDICKHFENSIYAADIYEYIKNEIQNQDSSLHEPCKLQKQTWLCMFYLMIHRSFLEILRDPTIQGMTVMYKTGLGFLLGICMRGTTTMTQAGIQSLKGTLLIMVAENFFFPTYAAMERIPQKLPIFQREYSNNMNTPLIFYLAEIISITPGLILDVILFTTLLYWLVELRSEFSIFSWTVFLNALVLNTSNAFGTVISVLTDSYQIGQVVVLPLDTIYMTLAGIFISLRTVPVYLSWVRYVSWMTFSIEALLILHIGDVDSIACPSDPRQPCLHTGEQVLTQLDFNIDNFYRNIIFIIIIYFVLHILGYCIFALKLYFKTKSRNMKYKTL